MIYWNITYWKQIALIQTTQPHSQTLKINLQLQSQLDGTTIPRPAHMFSVGHVILSVTSCRRLGKIVGGENTLSHVVTVVFFPPEDDIVTWLGTSVPNTMTLIYSKSRHFKGNLGPLDVGFGHSAVQSESVVIFFVVVWPDGHFTWFFLVSARFNAHQINGCWVIKRHL